jgi:cytochrome P450
VTTSTTPSPFTETTGPARHAAYAELATTGPVQKVVLFTGVPAWVVTGYAEARELLAHPALVKTVGGPHMDAMPQDLNAAMNTHLLSTNPPDHTRLRRLVAAAFTTRRVEALAPRVQEITDGLLDDMAALGRPGRRLRVPAADHRDHRAARHPAGRPRRVPTLVVDRRQRRRAPGRRLRRRGPEHGRLRA